MAKTLARRQGKRGRTSAPQRGFTLIETMVAVTMLLVVAVGVVPALTTGFQVTEQEGDLATRSTEYAQDKMESLMKLDFSDGATDTTVFPPSGTGGTGLGGAMAASATVGAVPPSAPATNYVDYLDFNGNLLTSSTGAYYARQWSITTDSTATLKTITVTVRPLQRGGVLGLAPPTTLVGLKSNNL